ncbi:MAG: hypothetical protein HY815_32410, partial [Candidatus Riflebacteria bacterium]|nr:hypothetical protein [Candidatus Riflebacteria bacterium]
MTKIDLIQRRHLHGSPTVHCFRFIVILVAVALALILSVFPLETVTTAGLGVATLLAFRSFQLASSWLWPGLEARAIAGHPEASNRPDRPDGPPLSLPSAPSVLFIEVDTPSGPARCAVCADPIADDAVACPDCGVPYHRECHEYLGGCAIYGCIPSLDPPGACRSPGPTGSGPELWRRDEGADGPEAPGRGLVMNGLFMLAGGSFAILGVFDPALVAFQAMTALVLS